MMEIKYICLSKYIENYDPFFQSHGASGVDLKADIPEVCIIGPRQTLTVSSGLAFEIPYGYEGQVRSRSGLASRSGIFMLNSPGTIDSDYRGVVSVVIANFSDLPFAIKPNDRIAQFVISPVPSVRFVKVQNLSETDRGLGGFGSTGV